MSSFSPLNLSVADIAFSAEEHTRELQIEEAFRIFEEALSHQKNSRHELADECYKQLFRIPVITDEGPAAASPIVRTLRYLAYRNRGLLRLVHLAQASLKKSPSNVLEDLLDAVNDLLEALQHTESDTIAVKLLLSIFQFFDNCRLQRFTLEYELTKEENDEVLLHNRRRTRNRSYLSFLKRECTLLESIHDSNSLRSGQCANGSVLRGIEPAELENLEFLKPVLEYITTRSDEIYRSFNREISLNIGSWKEIASRLANAMGKPRTKSQKLKDLYRWSGLPMESLKFTLSSAEDDIATSDENIDEKTVTNFDGKANCQSNNESTDGHIISQEIMVETDKLLDPFSKGSVISSNIQNTELSIIPIQEKVDDDKKSLKRVSSSDATQRSSKRFRQGPDTGTVMNEILDEVQQFIDSINSFLEPIGLVLDNVTGNLKDVTSDETVTIPSPISDFYNCLSCWSTKHSEFLFQSSTKPSQGIPITELISSNTFDGGILGKSTAFLENETTTEFLAQVNNSNLHFIQVRSLFINNLLKLGDTCLITDCIIDTEVYKMIESIAFTNESVLYDQLINATTQDLQMYLSVGISFLEIVINSWIKLSQESKVKGISQKQLNELINNLEIIEPIIEKWRRLLELILFNDKHKANIHYSLPLRYKWSIISYYQNQPDSPVDEVMKMLLTFYDDFKLIDNNFNVDYLNYETIPALNSSTIKSQTDKMSVLTTFENKLNTSEARNEDAVMLLETILLPHTDNSSLTSEQLSMVQFISKSSTFLKLKLWSILLDSYAKVDDFTNYKRGLIVVLQLLWTQMSDTSYHAQPEFHRQQILLKSIGFYSEYIEKFLNYLNPNEWHKDDSDPTLFKLILSFSKILFGYLFYEKIVLKTDSKTFHEVALKSSNKLRDTISNTFTLMFLLYQSLCTTQDAIYDFLSILHEQMGLLKFCDASHGRFLKLSQAVLKDVNTDKFEADILQHLNCCFHIAIASESYTPVDHQTAKSELNKESVLLFSNFLFKMFQKKKDPIFNMPKPDLKNGLDLFYQAIGDVDYNNSILQKNSLNIDSFLEMNLNHKTIINAMRGGLNFDTRKTDLEEQMMVDQGLYFFEATVNYNMFKSRKKAMQAKVTDLEFIIKMLKSDLSYGTRRVESWILLGEAFELQAEDDLIWTSDKINSFEKKRITANAQKKSILSYLMGLSMLMRNPNLLENVETSIVLLLFNSLSRELYRSTMKPMNGLCFQEDSKGKVMVDGSISLKNFKFHEKSREMILQLTLKLLKFSLKFDDKNWTTYFFITKVLHKLHKEPIKVLTACMKSCLLNGNGLEPHYQLCSLLYKYARDKRIPEDYVMKYLLEDKKFLGTTKPIDNKKGYEYLIIGALKTIIYWDKKKWHHRPKYRASMIYFQLGEFQKAFEEFESLVILKSTNKNLINIWKPENESPGKHFIYTFTYVCFYVRLMNNLAEYHNLLLFTKKLRRFGAGMVNLQEGWELSCLTLCLLTKEIIKAENGFTDFVVPTLVYYKFIALSKKLIEILKNSHLDDDDVKLLVLLYEISEIRRMNNGFGSTSQIDDTFNTIYLKIYLKWLSPEFQERFINDEKIEENLFKNKSENNGSNSNVKVKVARKEILAEATLLVKSIDYKIVHKHLTDDCEFKVTKDIIEQHLERGKQNLGLIDKIVKDRSRVGGGDEGIYNIVCKIDNRNEKYERKMGDDEHKEHNDDTSDNTFAKTGEGYELRSDINDDKDDCIAGSDRKPLGNSDITMPTTPFKDPTSEGEEFHTPEQ